MTDPADEVVQLEGYNVPSALLTARGVPLAELIGDQGAANVDNMMGPPPMIGWRVLTGDLAAPQIEVPVLVAPWPSQGPGLWMLIQVPHFEGQWHPVVVGGGHSVRPGRARRRRGLEVDWVQSPMMRTAGSTPRISVRLWNAGDQAWTNDHPDFDHVDVRVIGDDGAIPEKDRMIWASTAILVNMLPAMAPGAGVELTAHWGFQAVNQLPAGTYEIAGVLVDLELSCPPGVLILHK